MRRGVEEATIVGSALGSPATTADVFSGPLGLPFLRGWLSSDAASALGRRELVDRGGKKGLDRLATRDDG